MFLVWLVAFGFREKNSQLYRSITLKFEKKQIFGAYSALKI